MSQQTFYSRSSGATNEWSNPVNWSLDPSGEPAANISPAPTDHVIIRATDSIFHNAGIGYTHFGNVLIEKRGIYEIFTSDDLSDPYLFRGDTFQIDGNLITSSDFQSQITNEAGYLSFGDSANINIGDDLILRGFTNFEMDNDSCGNGITFDDLYLRGTNIRICGVGRFVIPHQVRIWDDDENELTNSVPNDQTPPDLTEAAIEQLDFITCEGFRFFNELADCLADTGDILMDFLPIELIHFDAQYSEGRVLLNWSTATEINNDFFTIERSEDRIEFVPMLTVKGAGTSLNIQSYSAYDEEPLEGKIYYRLKQTDFDGTVDYSHIVELTIQQAGPNMEVYPNPFTEEVTIDLNGFPPYASIQYSITDIYGREIARTLLALDSQGKNFIPFPGQLSAGSYFILAQFSGQQFIQRVVKQ